MFLFFVKLPTWSKTGSNSNKNKNPTQNFHQGDILGLRIFFVQAYFSKNKNLERKKKFLLIHLKFYEK